MPDSHHDVSSPSPPQPQQSPAQQAHATATVYEGFDPELPDRPGRADRSPGAGTAAAAEPKASFGGLNSVQVGASALAAVTSALAASFFGVAGTLIGAAVGSMVSTVAGAMYAESMRRAAARLKDAQTVVLQKIPVGRESGPADLPSTSALTQVGTAHNDETVVLVDRTDETSVLPTVAAEPAPTSGTAPAAGKEPGKEPGPRSWWKRPVLVLPVVALSGFLIALGVITASESVTGKSWSGDRGSSIGNLVSDNRTTGDERDEAPTETPAATPTGTPAATPSGTVTDPGAVPTQPSTTSGPAATQGVEPGTQDGTPDGTQDGNPDGFGSDPGAGPGDTGPGGSALGDPGAGSGAAEQPGSAG
jgi:hypothetical protein